MPVEEFDLVRLIREGLARQLAHLGEGEDGGQISPYALSSPTPPILYVTLGDPAVEYDVTAQRGADHWTFLIVGMAGAVDDIPSQMRLDRWLASSGRLSVKAAIETDRTLGLGSDVVNGLRVTTGSADQILTREGGGGLLTRVWTVQLYARGKGETA